MRAPAVVLVVLALCAGCDRSPTALIVRQRTTMTGLDERTADSTQYWTSKGMVADEPAFRIIVDFEDETITSLDKTRKTFGAVTFADMEARMAATRRSLETEVADLPPDALVELEKIGEPVGDRVAQVKVEPTGKRETIAGYEAEEYTIEATAVKGSLWVSPAVALPLGEEEKKAYRRSMNGMKVPNMQFALAMLELGAVPLRAELEYSLGPQGTRMFSQVVEVRREKVDAELFSVPDEYGPIASAAPLPQPSP